MINRKVKHSTVKHNLESMYEIDVPNSTLAYSTLQQLCNGGIPVPRPKISIPLTDEVDTKDYIEVNLSE